MFDRHRQRESEGMRSAERPQGRGESNDGRWAEPVLGMLDDLEMQAAGLHLADRAVEVGELSVAEYAEVELLGRLHASVGRQVHVSSTDGLEIHGRLTATGADWILVGDSSSVWFVHLPAAAILRGLAPGSLPAEARPLTARLSLRSALRRFAEDRRPCTIHLCGGRALQGNLTHVGADFAVLRQGQTGEAVTVPLSAVAVVQGRPEDAP
jgi:hypothetical protein